MYRGLPSADRGRLPVAAAASEQVLCLPIHPGLADEDVQRVVGVVLQAARLNAVAVGAACPAADAAPHAATLLPLAA
jgi:hypothetical protein